jgi:hypothetical protein
LSRITTWSDLILAVVVAGLAAGRVHQLVARDSITTRLRLWLIDHYPRVYDWVSCHWCAGFWYAAGLFALIYYVRHAGIWVGIFAAAHVVGLIGAVITTHENGETQ